VIGRREAITLLGGAAVAWPLAARAQAKVYAIGILETVPRAQNQANFAALLNGLRELGYVEGQNLHIDYRSADGQGERFPETRRGAGAQPRRPDRDPRNAGGAGR